MKDKVKNWYLLNHADDEMGREIDNRLTFEQLWQGINEGIDVYRLLGVADSYIRENVFAELARRKGVEYNVIYNAWLDN